MDFYNIFIYIWVGKVMCLKELWSLTIVRISFLINILRINGCDMTKYTEGL